MKVVYVCKGNENSAGMRGGSYDVRFINGLNRAGHAVKVYPTTLRRRALSPLGIKPIGTWRLGGDFMSFVARHMPDVILLSHTGAIAPAVFARLRRTFPQIRIAQLNVDALFFEKNRDSIRRWRDVCDAVFVTTGGPVLKALSTPSCAVHFMPNVSDDAVDTGRAFEIDAPEFDVCCFMHGSHGFEADQDNRIHLARSVTEKVPEIKTCYRGFDGQPSVYGAEAAALYGKSAMGLNLNRDSYGGISAGAEDRFMYSSDRIAHIMGNGALAFLQRGFGLETLYSNEEAVFFSEVGELVEKVYYYKNNPAARQAIARKGWEKAHHEYGCVAVMQYVLDRVTGSDTPPKAWEET